jgi:hypothetical protein
MEVVDRKKTILIHPGQRFPLTKMIADAGVVIILVWGVFAALTVFSGRAVGDLLPYFIVITLFVIIPFTISIVIRLSRYYGTILLDGDRRVLSLQGIWRSMEVPFEEIESFQVSRYRFKRNVFVFRLEALLSTGEVLRLVQDVPDEETLRALGSKIGGLTKRPLAK